MEVFEAVKTILAVREYQAKAVPPDVLQRILEAGHLTASSMNRQPWHFIWVDQPEMLKKLGEAAPTGPYIAQAPVAVVVAVEKDSPFAVSDGSRAIQSMVLAAWADGVGSNWVGFTGMIGINNLLDIPDTLQVLAIIPFGYPVKKIGLGNKKRKPFSEVVHHGKFGQPMA